MADKVTKKVDVEVGTPGAEDAGRKIGGLAQKLKELSQAGKSAGLTGDGGLIGILKGAGIAAGVKLGVDALANAASAAKEFADNTITGGQALLKLGEGIPILGSIVTLFKNGAEALDSWGKNLSGETAGSQLRDRLKKMASERTGLVGKADALFMGASSADATVGLSDPEKMRLRARQQFIAAGDQIEELTKLANLLQQKQQSLYFRATSANFGSEGERSEYNITARQLEQMRSQITQMEQFRLNARKAANKDAQETEDEFNRQQRHKFEEGLIGIANSVRERLRGFGETAVGGMQSLGDLLRTKEQERRDELDRRHELEMGIFMMEFDKRRAAESAMPSRYTSSPDARFLTGASASNANDPQQKTAQNTDAISKKMDANTAAIQDLARAIRENSAQIIPLN